MSHRMNLLTGFLIVTSGVLAPLGSQSAFSQITVQQLLSTSVEKYDSKYAPAIQAVAAVRGGDAAGAREVLVELGERYPELAPPDVLLAIIHLAFNQRRAANAAIDRAAAEAPSDAEAFVLLGELMLRDRQRLLAELAYQKAEEILESSAKDSWRGRRLLSRMHAGLASLAESRKRFDDAVTHLEAWIDLDANNPIALGSLGRVQFHREDYDAARKAFADLVKAEPEAPPMEIAMARLYSDVNKREEALTSMEAAVKSGGKDTRTRLTVAEWAIGFGHLELARENVEAVLKAQPESLGARVLSGRLSRYAGDSEQAEKVLTAAILESPNEFAVSNELARVLAMSPDKETRKAGLDYAKRNYAMLRSTSGSPRYEATMTYAWLLLRNGLASQAEKAMLTMPDASSVSSENAYYAAEIYAALGRKQLASQAFRAAIATDSHFPAREQAKQRLELLSKVDSTPD